MFTKTKILMLILFTLLVSCSNNNENTIEKENTPEKINEVKSNQNTTEISEDEITPSDELITEDNYNSSNYKKEDTTEISEDEITPSDELITEDNYNSSNYKKEDTIEISEDEITPSDEMVN